VLGIGACLTALGLAGFPLPSMCAGGLAALLALFVVADPGCRSRP